ncbi:peptidoglycan editing factor PgeF [Rubrivivax sp. A210]|uniref:peptidoglycan editing factor PgeF n=1 Tax=Rubrivivax sp. A210 TaxID=2772301 RepID=UPI00191A4F44|nr:peptidoglycan editing factor PgeF [Rubrivivax sp. A210]
MSTRAGGVSAGPWASLNLGAHCGDDAAAVAENRARFAAAIAARPVWLQQVHGCRVLELTPASAAQDLPPADAAWTTTPGLACTVQVADCLPVLLAARDGRAVAAAHAGWRGLAGGVLEATVAALCRGAGLQPGDLLAWLGPCIGPRQFEVGAEVLQAFGDDPAAPDRRRFMPRSRPDDSPRWLADLPGLARESLQAAGVEAVSGEGRCTVEEASAFFSFRRDGATGRLAAAIWRG